MLIFTFFYRRLSLYGLLVRAQRLSGCWDSAGPLMSSRYVDRVTTISDFIYLTYLKNWTITFFNLRLHLHPLALIESPIPHLQSQVLSRIYPTNIITGIRVFFLLMGHQGHTFPNCLSRHATIYHYAVFPFVLLFRYSHKNIARKRASSEYFFVRMCPQSYAP